LVVEGVFRDSGVVRSFKMVDPVLFVFGSGKIDYKRLFWGESGHNSGIITVSNVEK
jgi:hypothetical protein